MDRKTIEEMSLGETGMIIDMDNIEIKSRHRFMDLGLAPYARVTLLKRLFCKNLFIIDVDEVEICIRKADAKRILVRV